MNSGILQSEIHQQPAVIRELLDAERDRVAQIARELKGKFNYVVIAARGTSDNAARYAQYLFGAHNRLQVALATPSLFSIYEQPPELSGALIVGISQSGQSPDIVSVLAEGERQGRPTLAITNDVDSPLARAARFLIPLHAGPERAVAATKTYTASLAALALLSCSLDDRPARLDDLQRVPEFIEKTFPLLAPSIERVERYRYMEQCAVIGRGFNYSTAFEIALKIKELNRLVCEPYSSADFRHGPVATVSRGFPVFVLAIKGAIHSDLTGLLSELEQLGAELLVISDDQESLAQANLPLPLPPGLPEWLTPLVSVIPGQLFAMRLAVARGLDPDHPAGLTKVTETL
jgi:glucosamine--fructose-6-phosphate aminotransferase (isomerizing)